MKYLFLLLTSICFSQKINTDSLTVYYHTNKYQLENYQKEKVKHFLSTKERSLLQEINIKSYTDFVGNTTYNQKLSKRRSTNIFNFLKENKFNNITTKSLGEIFSKKHPKEGILAHRKTVIITKSKRKDTIYDYLENIKNLKDNDVMTLKNIHFMLASDTLIKASIPELNHLVLVMQKNPKLHIQIEGHVCCGESKEVETQKTSYENQWLSNIRAKKVYNYLIEHKIDSTRLRHKGFGFTQPKKFPENTEADKLENRRIEIRVIEKNNINKLIYLKKGGRIILKNINFEYGLFRLTPESYTEIKNIYNILKNYPKLIIAIEGHVCCGKTEEALGKITSQYNTRLSTNRANAVQKELLKMGINKHRIFAKGFGFSKPLYFPEETLEDKEKNHRIEVVILAR